MARIIREALRVVEWPRLAGEIELCDVRLVGRKQPPNSFWIATERRKEGPGLIRVWGVSRSPRADFSCITSTLAAGATMITPPSGVFRELQNLGFRQRGEPLGTADALPDATAAAVAFRRMLQGRRHHGIAAKTIDSYLGEFVFRHNAAVLGWTHAEQCERVLRQLQAPRSSA